MSPVTAQARTLGAMPQSRNAELMRMTRDELIARCELHRKRAAAAEGDARAQRARAERLARALAELRITADEALAAAVSAD